MEIENLLILVKLFAAHIVGDFIIQTDAWVKHKEDFKIKSKFLYFHSIIHGLLAYLFIAQFNKPLISILIMIIHFVIDLGKTYLKKNFTIFALDQLVHFVTIILLWMLFFGNSGEIIRQTTIFFSNSKVWIIGTAYILALWPASTLIHQFTLQWQNKLNENGDSSLPNAGKWIGRLERILILTFILIEQFEAIGFLLAAKSVFRFGDLKDENDRKRTEYILIGTLISFTITIGIGLVVRVLLK